jgi:hypothetical protein
MQSDMVHTVAIATAIALAGCSAPIGAETQTSASAELASCPSPSPSDDQMRAAATAAFDIMKGAAVEAAGAQNALQAYSVLSSQRYRLQSSGKGIEFDPDDPLYSHVTREMRAALAFAQLDSTLGQFLADGLRSAYAQTDGKYFPFIASVQALAQFTYPGPTTVSLLDHTSNSDVATVTGSPWCSTSIVTIAQTCIDSSNFSPLIAHTIQRWRSAPPQFVGTQSTPSTPFNGPSAAGNPYLIVTLNGVAKTWAQYDFSGADCTKLPNNTCFGSIEIDPVPYAEPGAYYDPVGNMLGTQSNPYAIIGTLYASPDHALLWATRVVNGAREWGQFSTPIHILGLTEYKYTKVF